MCWKRKPEPITGNKAALLFGINDYMGSQNDLAGCLNDVDDVEKKLRDEFPEFQIRKFKDSQVTTHKFIEEIENAYNTIQLPGVLYLHYSGHGTQIPNMLEANKYDEALMLYNGALADDNIWVLQQATPEGLIVVAKFDSCFSGDMNRGIGRGRERFYKIPGIRIMTEAVRKFNKTASDKWVIFSGCGENQTSSDAFFNGRANGAFTFYDLKSFDPDSTYNDEMDILKTYLPNSNFEQAPTLYGNKDLHENKVLTLQF
jgi:hypothetical protein